MIIGHILHQTMLYLIAQVYSSTYPKFSISKTINPPELVWSLGAMRKLKACVVLQSDQPVLVAVFIYMSKLHNINFVILSSNCTSIQLAF